MPDSNIFERRQGNHNSFHSFIYLTVLIIMASLPIVQTCQFKPRKGLRTPCSESIKTVVEVRSCPTSKESWAERALIKDCSKFLHNCSEGDPLIYHCVLDEDGKRLLEVCALMTQIKDAECYQIKEKNKSHPQDLGQALPENILPLSEKSHGVIIVIVFGICLILALILALPKLKCGQESTSSLTERETPIEESQVTTPLFTKEETMKRNHESLPLLTEKGTSIEESQVATPLFTEEEMSIKRSHESLPLLREKETSGQEEKEEDAGHNDSGLGKSMIDSPNKSNS